MPEWHGSLAEHIIDGFGPRIAEGRSVVAAVAVTPLAERACIAKWLPLAKHSQYSFRHFDFLQLHFCGLWGVVSSLQSDSLCERYIR